MLTSIIIGDEALAATGLGWSEDKYLHDFFGHVCSCCHIMLLMTLLFPYLKTKTAKIETTYHYSLKPTRDYRKNYCKILIQII